MTKLPLSDYPRPQFKRDSYVSLNGLWNYKITKNPEIPDVFDGQILVPYSPETPLSGVNKFVAPDDYLFYQRGLIVDKNFLKDKLIIHFGAVDQICDVYFNGQLKIHHEGGFLPFEICLEKDEIKESNSLLLRVQDFSDTSYLSRGKQRINRGGIWYSPQSGIYMPVWMESVPKKYIERIKITPEIDKNSVVLEVFSLGNEVFLNFLGKKYKVKTNTKFELKIDNPILWSPENPHLYEFEIETENDKISSYFAMRKFSKIEENGIPRLALNNKPYFMKGVLDQGYFMDGFLTPRSYSDYENDLKLLKDLGFNTVRKHIKIEPFIYYYLCDKLGLIVWQDFVNGGETYKFSTIAFPLVTNIHSKDTKYKKFSRDNEEGRRKAVEEFKETINLLYNVPSIGLWTIFNEGWGQFDSANIYKDLLKIDSTRIYDHASGWHDQKISETKSLHVYFKKVKMPSKKSINDRAVILSECGGYQLKIEGHTFNETNFGYKKMADSNALEAEYLKFINRDILPNIPKGLSAFIYTQLSDVEDELNGFITYDRAIVKVDKKKIFEINSKISY